MTNLTLTLELQDDLAVTMVAALLKAMERTTSTTAPVPAAPVKSSKTKSNWTADELTAWLQRLSPIQRVVALTVAEKAQTGRVATTEELHAVAAAAANTPDFTMGQLYGAYSWLHKYALKVRGTDWPGTILPTGVTMDKTVATILIRISKTVI